MDRGGVGLVRNAMLIVWFRFILRKHGTACFDRIVPYAEASVGMHRSFVPCLFPKSNCTTFHPSTQKACYDVKDCAK